MTDNIGQTRFPGRDFPWGSDVDVSNADNAIFKNDTQAWKDHVDAKKDWAVPEHKSMRAINKQNRFGIDETKYVLAGKDGAASKTYWMDVLQDIGLKPWVDKAEVIHVLAKLKPNGKQSNSVIWQSVTGYIKEAKEAGIQDNWAKILFRPESAIVAELEALRVAGDAKYGLGTMPKLIVQELKDAGLIWLMIDPAKRVIPACWKYMADRTHDGYLKILKNDAIDANVIQISNDNDDNDNDEGKPLLDKEISAKRFSGVDDELKQKLTVLEKKVWKKDVGKIGEVYLEEPDPMPKRPSDTDIIRVLLGNDEALGEAIYNIANELEVNIVEIISREITKSFEGGPLDILTRKMIDEILEQAGISDAQKREETIRSSVNRLLLTTARKCDEEDLARLKEKMESYEKELTRLKEKAEGREEKMEAMKEEVATVKESVQEIREIIAHIEERFAAFQETVDEAVKKMRANRKRADAAVDKVGVAGEKAKNAAEKAENAATKAESILDVAKAAEKKAELCATQTIAFQQRVQAAEQRAQAAEKLVEDANKKSDAAVQELRALRDEVRGTNEPDVVLGSRPLKKRRTTHDTKE